MTDNFHDLFKESVPEAPATTGWVAGARRKRRNRQMLASGVAALAVIGLAVPVGLNLLGSSEPLVASPQPTVSSPAPTTSPEDTPTPSSSPSPTTQPGVEVSLAPAPNGVPGAAACLNEAGEPVVEWLNTGTIEPGAARAWLCADFSAYGTGGPLEPLVTDVDGLINAFYAQPPLTDNNAQAAAEYYTVVFEYSDGRKMSFTGDVQDSTALIDGENTRQGGVAFYKNEVEARWLAQRAQLGAPVGDYSVPQECPVMSYQQSLFDVRLDAISGGYACAVDRGEPRKSVELPESLAAKIGAEALANGVPVEANGEGGDNTFVLSNVWGDRILLRQAGDRYEYRGDTSLMGWTPSPDFAAELDALFAGS
ncbi:MAG: hypothetical protein Q4G35_13410 [Propionibacteriaceae bacterium]|nr:hypothetical protein [Propionibacteriaceae bacterium]